MKAFNYVTETAAVAGTFEDIIFENRNKAYGAYALRKDYNNHLFYAFFITATAIVLVVLYPIIHNFLFPVPPPAVIFNTDITFDPTDIPIDKPIVVPPPPTPNVETNLKATNIFVAPQVVADAVETTTEPMTPDDVAPAVPDNTSTYTDMPVANTSAAIPTDNIDGFVSVQEAAMFMGGDVETFRAWIANRLKYPSYLEGTGITGNEIVKFAINKYGEVCDIKILKSLHPTLDKDIEKLLLSSPHWIPAKNNGEVTKQIMTLPIAFKLHE